VQGERAVVAFHRRISVATVYRATAIVTIGLTVGFVAVVATLLTQDMPVLMAVFEVVSAMGTVGLTIGGTERLDEVGKLIIMVCMFAGRVGPLTLFMFLSRGTPRTLWKHPTQDIDVG
jgi:trk system potassium uptake protein TrkH